MSFPISWSSYAPALEDIPQAEFYAEWELLTASTRAAFPDLDTRPGTPFADLFLIPAAKQRAAMRTAAERMLSDLDLANIQEGIVYNCDFVEAYLNSLGVGAERVVPATGVLLLQFSSEGPFELKSSALFGDTQVALQVSGTYSSGVITFGTAQENDFQLFRMGQTVWAAEVPVHGTITPPATGQPVPLAEGVALGVDSTVPGLVAAVTAIPIDPGYPKTTLRERARMVPKVFPGLNTNTPAGLSSWVMSVFPSTQAVSPVVDGDVEMRRQNPDNIFGLVDGKTDLYIRGSSIVSRTLTIPITRSGASSWNAPLDAGSPILKVTAVRLQDTQEPVEIFTVTSASSQPDVLPTPAAGFTGLEQLTLHFNKTVPTANQVFEEGANPYAYFEVDVLLDPHVVQVEEKLKRRDFSPVLGNILVRPFIPVFLNKVRVFYRRQGGKEIRKAEAREEIVNYLMSAAYPDAVELGGIAEIAMFYGARGVNRVEYDWSASLTPSSATQYGGTSTSIPDDWAAGIGPRNTCPIVFPEAVEFYAVV